MICRHNWEVHKTYSSKRYRSFKEHDLAIPLLVVIVIFAGFAAMVFLSTFINIGVGYTIAVLSYTFTSLISFIITMFRMDIEDYDPWVNEDKTCIKCDRLVVDATTAKEQHQRGVIKKQKRKEENDKKKKLEEEKANIIAIKEAPHRERAKQQYEKYMKFKKMAGL